MPNNLIPHCDCPFECYSGVTAELASSHGDHPDVVSLRMEFNRQEWVAWNERAYDLFRHLGCEIKPWNPKS